MRRYTLNAESEDTEQTTALAHRDGLEKKYGVAIKFLNSKSTGWNFLLTAAAVRRARKNRENLELLVFIRFLNVYFLQ